MPPTNSADFRRFIRRQIGITEAVEARFNRPEKPVCLAQMGLVSPQMGAPQVFCFGPIMGDDLAVWYREGPDDIISVTSPGSIRKQLDAIPEGQDFELLVNSDGGDVAAATAAGAMIDDRITGGSKVHTRIVGDALSAASLMMLRSTSSEIDPMGLVMVHCPWTFTYGNADDLEREADVLRKIENGAAAFYASRTPWSEPDALAAMKATTWFSAQEIVDAGIIGKVSSTTVADERDQLAAAAREDLNVLCAGVNARRAALYDAGLTREEV